MIISHKHRFIFLHCRKVAGSSMTVYLNRFLGPYDLQIGVWDETIRLGGKYNRKFLFDLASAKAAISLANGILAKINKPSLSVSKILNGAHKSVYQGTISRKPAHALATEVRGFFEKEWSEYFKFCFVRSPYDRAVSDYRWRTTGKRDGISFLEFLKRIDDTSRHDPEGVVPTPATNWPIYTIDDQVVVDFIGKYENLTGDFAKVCEHIGVPFEPALFPVARGRGSGQKDYRDYYGYEERKLVSRIYRNEIDYFCYNY
jgi:hypothetical protein